MRLSSYLLSFFILFLYGFLLIYFVFFPIDISNYEISDDKILSTYDYIVIGAGSAGSVISALLAEKNFSVFLIEAGGSDKIEEIIVPAAFPAFFNMPQLQKHVWDYSTIVETEGYKKELPLIRAKVVGGCGSINANVWNRGNHEIYNKWEKMGAKNWNYKSIKKYFDKAEERLYIESDQYIHPSISDLLNEAQRLYGATPSFNEKSNGWAKFHTTKRMGRRFSSSDAYLKPTLRKYIEKFHLKLNTKVNKLLFNELKDQVIGIEFKSNDSKKMKTVKAKYEVIISAGAFGTPEILLRNGIGNKTELSNLNINLIKDIPGVGKNLIDHATTAFTYKTKETKWQSLEYIANNTVSLIDYLLFGTGSLSSNLAEIGGYVKTKFSKYNDVEDIQFHCGPLLFAVEEFSERRLRENDTSNYISCLISTVIPRDIGYINLKSNKEDDKSIIVTNFLKNEDDYKSIIEGFSYAKKIFETQTFKNKVEMYIPNQEELKNDINFKNYIFRSLFEVYHPVGTSKMGDLENDEMAVVDSELKVRGFKNLRIVDASIMPEITNSNTNSPTIMIAEKAADMILNKKKL